VEKLPPRPSPGAGFLHNKAKAYEQDAAAKKRERNDEYN
jgi:hypothetical protein